VVDDWRGRGERVGMIRIKMFRPFPHDELRALCSSANKVGVLDRNYGAGLGGIFCQEGRAGLQGQGDHLVQSYLTGVGGGDVVPEMLDQVVADLSSRDSAGDPVFKGLEP